MDDNTYYRITESAFEKEGIHGVSGRDIVRTASRLQGVPYSFGGTTPRAFDCSGYVQYVFRQHKAALPRTADLQYEKGMFVTQRQLLPGDLVFFTTYEPGASHVGIYAARECSGVPRLPAGCVYAVCVKIIGVRGIMAPSEFWYRIPGSARTADQSGGL